LINQQEVNDWLNKLLRKVFSGEPKEFSILKNGETYLFCEGADSRGQIVYRSYLTLHVSDVISAEGRVTRAEYIKAPFGNGQVISNLSEKNFVIGCFKRYLISEIKETDLASEQLIQAMEIGLQEVYGSFKGNVVKERTPLINVRGELSPIIWFKDFYSTIDNKSFYIYWTGTRFSYCLKEQPQLPLILEVKADKKIAKTKIVKQLTEMTSENKYAITSEIINLRDYAEIANNLLASLNSCVSEQRVINRTIL